MKGKLNRFLMVTIFAALVTAPRQSQGKVMVMAALDEAAVGTLQTQTGTTVAVTPNASAAGVGINTPSSRHPTTERAIDVVALVAVVLGCMVPIAIVSIVFYSRHRRLKMHHETIRAMIEKGMPIPPEMAAGTRGDLLSGNTDVRPRRSDFRGGLILVAIGSALLMIVGKVGWILVFIGAARLVFWLVEDRNPKV
jgi:hypothetical protein